MTLDPLLLSRIQFAWVIGWHILLPAFTVGAASYIALLEGLYLTSGRGVYLESGECRLIGFGGHYFSSVG